ncbi:MAG: nucleotidyltransferase family protein [Hydrogenothermaceae bacterium]|nr:nucleotidyltransferase family protein [Hydrogenothermaceae bacterium]
MKSELNLKQKEELEEIKSKLRLVKPILEEKYYVKEIGIFGSYVKGRQNRRSDIDILVEFKKPIDLFKFIELKHFLQKSLGKKIDLVMKSALKPRIGKKILEEAIYV